MLNNFEVFNQIAFSLAKHYECVYYVNLETNHYIVFSDSEDGSSNEFPDEGDDFFFDCLKNADKFIHPDDISIFESAIDLLFSGKAEIQPIHYRARRKDGTYVLLHTRAFVLTDKNGAPEYFGGIVVTDEN